MGKLSVVCVDLHYQMGDLLSWVYYEDNNILLWNKLIFKKSSTLFIVIQHFFYSKKLIWKTGIHFTLHKFILLYKFYKLFCWCLHSFVSANSGWFSLLWIFFLFDFFCWMQVWVTTDSVMTSRHYLFLYTCHQIPPTL